MNSQKYKNILVQMKIAIHSQTLVSPYELRARHSIDSLRNYSRASVGNRTQLLSRTQPQLVCQLLTRTRPAHSGWLIRHYPWLK